MQSTLTDIRVTKIAGALGAEITGIDLTQTITDNLFSSIKNAFLAHQVIFFRDQDISPAQHHALASRFGPLQAHPAYPHIEGYPELTILESTPENPTKIEKWHTDMTFGPRPPMGSILHGVELPPFGGDTMWSSMSAAFEGLSLKMQEFLEGLTAVHDFAFGFKESLAEPGGPERLQQAMAANPPVVHPVIRTHPETGKKGIFVNSLFTRNIAELSSNESDNLLSFLYKHSIQPEFTCRFRWEKNSIAIWDNRITQHKPINDYFPNYRRMQRITIDGDKPY